MGKNKKISEKVKLFYRGPVCKPTKLASQDDMQIIFNFLNECLPLKSILETKNLTTTTTTGTAIRLKLLVGLTSSLRALKQRKTKAIVYDETTSEHLSKYLIEFSRLQGIPCVQASGLSDRAELELKFPSLLVFSLAVAPESAASGEKIVTSESLDKLCEFLRSEPLPPPIHAGVVEFRPPVVEKVPISGKSREKKTARRAKAAAKAALAAEAAKTEADPKQTHVVKIKRVKMSKKQRHAGKSK